MIPVKHTCQAYESFIKSYQLIFDQHFPEKNFKCCNKMMPRNEWITKGLMKSCIRKSKLYKCYCQNRTKANKDKYVAYRNKLKILLSKAEKKFYLDKFSTLAGNLRLTWKLLNSITNKSNGCSFHDTFQCEGVSTSDKYIIVDKFNDYFVKIGSQLAANVASSSKEFSSYLKLQASNSFSLYLSDPVEVCNIICSLKDKCSAGFDSIPVNIMKASMCYILIELAFVRVSVSDV
jgi:hypothetical protein